MDFIRFIETNQPFVFAKFGDGEYNAVQRFQGGNCDGTPYTPKLGEAITRAFNTLTPNSNVYIGRWADSHQVSEYFGKSVSHPVNWENYNMLIFRSAAEFFNRAMPYYVALRRATQQKIYVCNDSMVGLSRAILGVTDHVVIDPVNWFETQYDQILSSVKQTVRTPESLMILTSAGMGAKPLIADLYKLYPHAIIIDIGSAMDLICSHRRTRDYHTLSSQEVIDISNAIAHSSS
jgi:hypothetical protein